MFVCLLVCLLFIGHTRFPTLRRCLRVRKQEPSRAGGPARAGKHAQRSSESTRVHAVQKIVALMPFKNKPYARACCRIRKCRDFQKKGKRKPTCHFTSSVYSSPSLGVFTFRIVLNSILHKSSLLAPMESRRTRRPTFTADERLERRGEQDCRRHAERRARQRREQTQAQRMWMWIACGLPKPVPRSTKTTIMTVHVNPIMQAAPSQRRIISIIEASNQLLFHSQKLFFVE